MATLLLRFTGPMQSWGTQSRFGERDTGLEPSKSGAIGLLCAALGRPREESVDDLAALRMGVRVDQEGIVKRDYHTLGLTIRPDGKKTGTVLSNRYYLADASFLVGFEGDDLDLLKQIEEAVDAPRWQIFFGRKSFVPGLPLRLPDRDDQAGGIRSLRLRDALKTEPWWPSPVQRRRLDRQDEKAPKLRLRLVIESDPEPGAERRFDQPAPGAAFLDRSYLPRYVKTDFHDAGNDPGDIPIGDDADV